MVARKLVEYGSDETFQPLIAAKAIGLKAAHLPIDTTNTRWGKPLQERTNAGTRNNPRSLPINCTPDTSCAIGIPSPDYIVPASNPEHQPAESLSRRLKRYSLAEEALASTLQNRSPEASPQELQIRALRNATALLGAHAKDAQERAAKLRLLLTDREVDRKTYESLQRERWMEEKRQLAVDHEVKVVRQHLASLTQSFKDGSVEPGKDPAMDANAKRQANLARFFELSLARAPISTHRPKLPYIDRAPRRRTICHVSPMQLRTSSIVSAFSRPIKGHSRSVSLDGKQLSPELRTSFGRLVGLPISTSLSVVTEDPAADQLNTHEFTPLETSDVATGQLLIPRLTPTWTGMSSRDNFNRNSEGLATIYEPMQARSKAEILADWATEDVTIPDYALNLMEHLDDILDDITLRSRLLSQSYRSIHFMPRQLHSPSPSSSPSPSRPTTPPRHRPFFSLDSSPSRPKPKKTPIIKKHSHRHLPLFAIPEGSPSRDSISGSGSDTLQPSQAITRKSSSFFSRDRHETPPRSRPPGRAGFVDSDVHGLLDDPVTLANKVRRKFSILRRK